MMWPLEKLRGSRSASGRLHTEAPEAFLERAYREVLGRAPDPVGRQAYLKALRSGAADPLDIVVALVRSEEHVNRVVREANPLPDITCLRPERFRTARHLHEDVRLPVYDAASREDFDWLAEQVVENGYYELPGCWALEMNPVTRLMADFLARLRRTPVLELGCASGTLLQALMEVGIDAEGIEISQMAVRRAAPRVRPHIHVGDLLEAELPRKFGLIVGLDIFEHLNPNRLGDHLCAAVRHLTEGGLLFANIPAIGSDPVFGEVCPLYLEDWSAPHRDGRIFTSLQVDDRGYPLQGHLAWAGSTWWVAQFESAGLVREPEFERALHVAFDAVFEFACPARRAFYVFSNRLSQSSREDLLRHLSAQEKPVFASGPAGSSARSRG